MEELFLMASAERDEANKRNHLRQISSRLSTPSKFKRLSQLNSEFKLAKHDLELLVQVKYITQREMDEQMVIMEHHYVEAGLKIGDEHYED